VVYVEYLEDITGCNPGDAIEIYIKSSDGANTATSGKFYICGANVTSIATEMQATAS